MDIHLRGKRMAAGITTAAAIGSLTIAGVGAAALNPTAGADAVTGNQPTTQQGGTASGNGTAPDNATGGPSGSTPDRGTPNGYGGTSPVLPGNGGAPSGRSGGS